MFPFVSPGPVFCLTRNSMVIAVGHRGRTLKCTVGGLNEYMNMYDLGRPAFSPMRLEMTNLKSECR